MLIRLIPMTEVSEAWFRGSHASWHAASVEPGNPDWDPPLLVDGPAGASYTSWSRDTRIDVAFRDGIVASIDWCGPARAWRDGGVSWLRPVWQPGGDVSLVRRIRETYDPGSYTMDATDAGDAWRIESIETTRAGDLLDRLGVPEEHRSSVAALVRESAL